MRCAQPAAGRARGRGIAFLMLTGARRNEVLTARGAIRPRRRPVQASAHTKQKRSHRVPLSAAARAVLVQLAERSRPDEPPAEGYVFGGPGMIHRMRGTWEAVRRGKFAGAAAARSAARLCQRAGVRRPVPADHRRPVGAHHADHDGALCALARRSAPTGHRARRKPLDSHYRVVRAAKSFRCAPGGRTDGSAPRGRGRSTRDASCCRGKSSQYLPLTIGRQQRRPSASRAI